MKNLLVSLFVLLVLSVSNPLYAQWAVADAPNLAQNVKNFSELQKQVSLLNEQKSRLDESLDLMRKVNTTISNSVTVKILWNVRSSCQTNAWILSESTSSVHQPHKP